MLPLKAYLLHWHPEEGWNITVHRDLDSLASACKSADFERDQTVVIHVGFWRPDSDAFQEVVERFPGVVLVTSSAKDALPPPLATTGKPVCLVKGLGIFPILSGWGYETTEEELGVATEWQRQLSFLGIPLPSVPVPLPFDLKESSEWITRLSIENPVAFQAAIAFGIKNDDSLFAREMALPDKLRSYLNVFRFKFITGELPSEANVLDWLHLAGTSLLQAPISNFEISVRATNIFETAVITHVYQIAELRTAGLFGLKNMGKKTVTELATLMLGKWFPGYREGDTVVFEGGGDAGVQGEGSRQDESLGCHQDETAVNFLCQLEEVLNRFTHNRQSVIRMRMGLGAPPKTLEDIGKDLGVSRERVRQLETGITKILGQNALFREQLVPRLHGLLKGRNSALPLFGLDVLDSWFTGVADNPHMFEWVLDRCCGSVFSLINHNGQCFVTQLTQRQWDELIEATISLLKSQVDAKLTRAEAKSLVNGMLIGPGEELRNELWESLLPNLNFSGLDGDEDLLLNVGSKLATIVEAVLVEASTPIHINEIQLKVFERSGRHAEENRVRKILSESAFLFARGTYGLRSHLELSDEEIEILKMECEDIIVSSDSQRQWHASEIYSALAEACPELYAKITPYIIGIALRKSEQLVSLGRMVWTAKQAANNGSAFRIDIHQAIVSLLRNEGRPMTAVEIRQQLLRDRGLNSVFQIVMEDPLIRVGRGLWGLIDRDLPFTQQEQERVIDRLLLFLNTRQRGIHCSVIMVELAKLIPSLDLNIDPSMIFSIAQRSGCMKVDMGGYLYLPEWGNARWPSCTEIVSEVIERNPTAGWTIAEILPVVESKLERPIEPTAIYKAIESIGGTFDPDARRWFFLADPDDLDEGDAFLANG